MKVIATSLMVGFICVAIGFSFFREGCLKKIKDFRPAVHWKGGCSLIPQFFEDSFHANKLQTACSLIPDIYNAPILPIEQKFLPYEQENVSQVFAVSAPNAVGTTQLKNGVSYLHFGENDLCEESYINNPYKQTPRGPRSFHIERGYRHPVGKRSMLFVKGGVNFFDPIKTTLTPIAGGSWAFPIVPEGNFIFAADQFVVSEIDIYGRVLSERKTDTLELRVVDTRANQDIQKKLLPFTLSLNASGKKLFHCKNNKVMVFDSTLQQIDHPISKALRKIPGIDTLTIYQIEVHPTFPIAFLNIGFENPKTYEATKWLWMLNWSDPNRPSAMRLTEKASLLGFSFDHQWFQFRCQVPLPNSRHYEHAFFVFQIRKSGFDHGYTDSELLISGPIRLWIPSDLQSVSQVQMSNFTWVTEPTGVVMTFNKKILRWTFPE